MPTIINAGQTALTITPDTTGALTLQANGTNALQITANGQITTANAPFILTGGRIQFPSTKIASADANCLDDYEEGTWTPSLTADSGTATYGGDRVGRYTKIGRFVFINCVMTGVGKNTLSGNMRVSGLPFINGDNYSNALMRYQFGASVAGFLMVIPQSPVSSQQFDIQLFNDSGYAGQLQASNCGSTIDIYSLTACYSI